MRQNPDLILREIYGKNILMPIRFNEASNDPIYFNEVGALIWKLSDKAKNVTELLNLMPLEQAVELVRGRMEKALAEVMEQGATL